MVSLRFESRATCYESSRPTSKDSRLRPPSFFGSPEISSNGQRNIFNDANAAPLVLRREIEYSDWMKGPMAAAIDSLQQPGTRWRALLSPLLVTLAALVLTTLASFTTLPLVGWGGSGTLILLFFPLILVGWMSVPDERILLVLLATAVYVLFYVLLWRFADLNWIHDMSESRQDTFLVAVVAVPAYFLGVLAFPLYLLAPPVIGIGIRKLTRIPIDRAPILVVLCLAIAGVLYYSWSVDGWRYICAEASCTWPVVHGDPTNPVHLSDRQYREALTEAARNSLARGDRERAREILLRSLRFGAERSIAKLLPEAGTYKEVESLLTAAYPDERQRVVKFIDICVETGDFPCARFFADGLGLSDSQKFNLYRQVASGNGRFHPSHLINGHWEMPNDAIGELFRLAETDECRRGMCIPPRGWWPQGGDVYADIALIQGRAGLIDDAVATMRQHVHRGQGSALSELGDMASGEQARDIFATARESILEEPELRTRDADLERLVERQIRQRLFDEAEKTALLVADANEQQCLVRTLRQDQCRLLSKSDPVPATCSPSVHNCYRRRVPTKK